MSPVTTIEVQPDPERVIEGLRDTGYDFNTAIADLIDNSIAAKAKNIHLIIDLDFGGNVIMELIDDGIGMDHDGLINAMQYGSMERSDPMSLGKFGLGLKTASTSFCRKFSVVSRSSENGKVEKATWDLDFVAQEKKWSLILENPSDENFASLDRITKEMPGTLVKWEKVDRLLKRYSDPTGPYARAALDRKVNALVEHIEMTYERFLDRDDRREQHKINITVEHDGETIQAKPWDPFVREYSELVAKDLNKKVGYEDSDEILGEFDINAYVLPHKSEFEDQEDFKSAKISNKNQGFYVYRQNRLINGGSWMGMYSQEPHGSLLRVDFSFDHTLDELFNIDIKKSRIALSEYLYQWLKEEFLPAPRRHADKRYREMGKKPKIDKESKSGAHDKSNKNIGEKDGRIDKAKIEKVDQESGTAEITNPRGTSKMKLNISSSSSNYGIYIEPVNEIKYGVLWDPQLVKDISGNFTQAVQINTGHEFYEKVYIPNITSNDASNVNIQGLDALLWALGIAELKSYSDDTKRFFEDLKIEVARILNTLVEDFPGMKDEEL